MNFCVIKTYFCMFNVLIITLTNDKKYKELVLSVCFGSMIYDVTGRNIKFHSTLYAISLSTLKKRKNIKTGLFFKTNFSINPENNHKTSIA